MVKMFHNFFFFAVDNAIAVFFTNGKYDVFDSHGQDISGLSSTLSTSVLGVADVVTCL